MADMDSTSELREQVAALQAENQKLHTINKALMYRVEEGGGNLNAAYSVFEHSVQLALHVNLKTKELNSALEQLHLANQRLSIANDEANLLKQRFHDAIESINEAFVLLDGKGNINFQNSMFESYWYETPITPRVGDNYYQLKSNAKKLGVILNVIPGKHNTTVYYMSNQRWFQLTERPTNDGGIVLLFTDITALKQAESQRYEKAIQAKNDLLQNLLNNLAQGVLLLNEHGRPEVWNDAFLRYSGLTKGTLLRSKKIESVNRKSKIELLSETKQNETIQILEDESVFQIKRVRLDNGKVILTYSDITESYIYAETLKENEKWLRTITDNVPAMIAYIDKERCFRFVNKKYQSWYGNDSQILMDTQLNETVQLPNYGLLEPYINRALDGETVSFESREIDEFGNEIYLLKSYVPNRNANQNVDGFFVLATDVTDRINAAQALQLAYDELEDRVEQRTSELREANESKSKFLAAVSHDLLQPLNAAQLFVNALLGQKNTQENNPELLHSMQNSLFDLENLIVSLIDISKLDAGVVKADKTIFPIDKLLANITSDYERISVKYNVLFKSVPCHVYVCSDSVLLARILRNYLSNALRHTPNGKVLLGCRRQGNFINIEVWDNGDGIAKDDLGVIFKEFKRLKASPRAHQSLGLGLAIVDKMAKVLEHNIDVHSTLGRGSCFSVKIPIAEPIHSLNQKSQSLMDFRPDLAQTNMTIWVIDNDQAICLGMKSLLSNWGFTVLTAESLGDLSESCDVSHDQCDLLIVDYHLNDENGFDVSKAVNRQRGKRVPTIMITANYSPELQSLTKQHHITLLNKPVKPLKLKMSLQHLLKLN
jgi:PAS domain S-box-containing protein